MQSILVHPKDKKMAEALLAFVEALKVPFEQMIGEALLKQEPGKKKKEKEEKPYNPEYAAKILESQKDFEEDRFVVIKTEA